MSDKGPLAATDFHIQPKDIDATQHFWRAFGNMETEDSARVVVLLCQEKGGWFPFTYEEASAKHMKSDAQWPLYFNKLNALYFEYEHGTYRVTERFVEQCYKSSPKVEI